MTIYGHVREKLPYFAFPEDREKVITYLSSVGTATYSDLAKFPGLIRPALCISLLCLDRIVEDFPLTVEGRITFRYRLKNTTQLSLF